jgi:hypothetical protein
MPSCVEISKVRVGLTETFAFVLVAAGGCVAGAQSTDPQLPTDWDLHMLRLVNRARVDPAGEDQRQGTTYAEPPVPPLAYSVQVGRAAQNHNEWMGANRHNDAIVNTAGSNVAPDAFSHFETLNGQAHGESGRVRTRGWSGDTVADRVDFAGFAWSAVGENIFWRSNTPHIEASLMAENHAGWWNSPGHRANVMSPLFTVFGHHGLNDADGDDRNHWATQNFARPLNDPRTFLMGLVYEDQDGSGGWTPTGDGREGWAGVALEVYRSGTDDLVATGSTQSTGAYAVPLGSGVFDIVFRDAAIPGGSWLVTNLQLSGQNLDAGDLALVSAEHSLAGDTDLDGDVDFGDFVTMVNHFGQSTPYWQHGNFDGDPEVAFADFVQLANHFGDARSVLPVPEPGGPGWSCWAAGWGLALASCRASRRRVPRPDISPERSP